MEGGCAIGLLIPSFTLRHKDAVIKEKSFCCAADKRTEFILGSLVYIVFIERVRIDLFYMVYESRTYVPEPIGVGQS